jgi:ATP/maltotriose-dependent transcriptional regulator MalT
MRSLLNSLCRLNDITKEERRELGLEIVAQALKLTREEAARWLDSFGNPILDATASSLLSIAVGLNPEVIRLTCLSREDADEFMEDEALATSMTRMTLEALIVFSKEHELRH